MSDIDSWPDPSKPNQTPTTQPDEELAERIEKLKKNYRVRPGNDQYYGSKNIWKKANPIALLRVEKNMTVRELANQAEISPNHLSKCNTGTDRMAPDTCAKIAQVLGVGGGPLYLAYLEWLALEPTIHRKEVRRISINAMRKCNPIEQWLKQMRMTVDWLSATSGLSIGTVHRLTSDPDMSPTSRTFKRVAGCLGVDHVEAYRLWNRWADHFRHLNVEDRVVAALEYEAMEEEEI